MAGTLIVNENDDWLPPGWLFDSVLRRLSEKLPDDEEILREILRRADTSRTSYADLRKLDASSFKLLVSVADRAYEAVVSDGPGAFHEPSAFPAYLRWFNELRTKLKKDSRTKSSENR